MEKELTDIISSLAEFTKTASPMVWAALMKQQILQGIASMGFFAISVFGFIIAYKYVPKSRNPDDITRMVALVFLLIISGIAFIVFIAEGMPRFINPVYYAIMELKP